MLQNDVNILENLKILVYTEFVNVHNQGIN